MDKLYFRVKGYLECEPPHITKKHESLSSDRLISIINLSDNFDLVNYYQWFFNKEYHVKLLKPLRLPHVTLINKYWSNIKLDNLEAYRALNGKEIDVEFDLSRFMCNDNHVWLNVSDNSREELYKIIDLISIERPHIGLHMTIGSFPINDRIKGQFIKQYLYDK